MKNFLKKYWALLGLIFAFVLDNSFDILKGLQLSELSINLIKGFGTLIYGYYFTSQYNNKKINKQV